jgi:hypothetical protein
LYEDLEPHLDILDGQPRVGVQISQAFGGQNFDFIIASFLKGMGIPCPPFFAAACNHFDPKIDLSKIAEAFNPRSLPGLLQAVQL